MQISSIVKIAVFVRAARYALNMSQSELALLAKCSRPTINRIESMDKESTPRLETVESILKVFSDRGIELNFSDSEVLIRFKESSLAMAELRVGTKTEGLLGKD